MDADRRDYTNQHGYQVPTETAALFTIDKAEKAEATARKIYGIFVRICTLTGFRLSEITLERDEHKFTPEDFTSGK